jgi:hypothetical protein
MDRLEKAKLYDDILRKYQNSRVYQLQSIKIGAFKDISPDYEVIKSGFKFLQGDGMIEFDQNGSYPNFQILIKGLAILSDIDNIGYVVKEKEKIKNEKKEKDKERIQIAILIISLIGVGIGVISLISGHHL